MKSSTTLRSLVFALAALPCAVPAMQLTVYSSAQPGTLSPQLFRSGGEAMTVPGYAMVREDRRFDLEELSCVEKSTDRCDHS